MLLLLLLFLGLLSPSLFAAVDCYQVGVDTWVCYQTSPSGGDDPSGSPVVITNVLGVCTNCVSMSPDDCTSSKNLILSDLARLDEYLGYEIEAVSEIAYGGGLAQLIREGDQFIEPYIVGKGSAKGAYRLETDITDPTLQQVQDSFDGALGILPAGDKRIMSIDSAAPYSAGSYYGGIYTYYNEAVKPLIEDTQNNLQAVSDRMTEQKASVSSLSSFVSSSINCSECQSSLPEGTPPSITLPPSGSGSSSGCPCKEQIEGLKNVSVSIETSVNDAVEVLKRIETMIRNISISQRDLVSGVSNLNSTVSRIDDYVQDDLSKCIKEIQNTFSNYVKVVESSLISSVVSNTTALADLSVSLSASNLVSVFTAAVSNEWREPFISLDYSNQAYRVISNADHSLLDTDDGFQFGLFATNYTWFSRVEYLLMRSAGLFDSVGDTNVNFSSSEQEEIDKIKEDDWQFLDFKTALLSKVTELQNKRDVFKPFGNIFDIDSQDLPTKITFLPDISLGDASDGVIGGGGGGGGGSGSSSQANFISLIGSTFPAIEMDLTFKDEVTDSFCLMDFVKLAHTFFKWFWYLIGFICVFGMVFVYVRLIIRLLRWFHKIVRSWAINLVVDRRYNL